MPSKGVDYFGYLDNTGAGGTLSIAFSGPKVGSTLSEANNFVKNNLQIDSKNISGPFNFDGTFEWAVSAGSTQLASQQNKISSLTGNIVSGTMTNMMDMPPVFTNGMTITYGFYDSGPGTSGLTNQDQSWVYCAQNMTQWMGNLVSNYSSVGTQPFYMFTLPGAHDSGMCTMATVEAILSALLPLIGLAFPVLAGLGGSLASNVIMNAAITQKDTITNMLNIGCRYFDFRPGTMYPGIPGYSGIRFHQHSVIPGCPYIQFLEDVLNWLAANPTEIVVVSCNTQGFSSDSMKPTASDLQGDLNTAFSNTGINNITTGDASNLSSAYNDLINSNTRLIFLNQIEGETTKYDSYADSYATLSPGPILTALEGMTTSGQQGYTYTVLQLQGTASGCIGKTGFLSESLTASPLMSTKAYFDASTLPWVLNNANANLTAAQPIVLLNDFIDNATVDTAIAVTLQRMGISGSF